MPIEKGARCRNESLATFAASVSTYPTCSDSVPAHLLASALRTGPWDDSVDRPGLLLRLTGRHRVARLVFGLLRPDGEDVDRVLPFLPVESRKLSGRGPEKVLSLSFFLFLSWGILLAWWGGDRKNPHPGPVSSPSGHASVPAGAAMFHRGRSSRNTHGQIRK